jgi:hypothetical protein
MKIKLEANFTQADIDKITADYMNRIFKVTKNELMQIGLQFVRDARSKIPTKEYHLVAGDASLLVDLSILAQLMASMMILVTYEVRSDSF